MAQSLDDIRARHPDLGLALYAFEPAGVVTLEIYAPDGEVYAFKARTVAEAIAIAFPDPGAAVDLDAGTKRVLPVFMTRKDMPRLEMKPALTMPAPKADIFADEPAPAPTSIFD
jgi:hypothetical protein